jgi:retron-type reverse transcriptase
MNTKNISLYDRVRDRQVLLRAWRVIRANAERSGNTETRKAAMIFEEKFLSNIENIQRRLRKGTYDFAKARGIAVRKGKNKQGKRAIVIAPLQDRVVQRAILDVIYQHCDVPAVLAILNTRTSVGGVPGLGIGHALALIEQAATDGATYVIKSDIHDFFPSLPRTNVTSFLHEHINDKKFTDLFEKAVTVELSNHDILGKDSELFPLGEDGVAQGSPLSVLAGNIVLHEFDKKMNGRGVMCVRYIDDFAILAPNKRAAEKTLANGLKILAALNLQAYSPDDGSGKAAAGPSTEAYDFLGYKIVKGLNPPSDASCKKLLEKIDTGIVEGKKWINRCIRHDTPEVKVRQCYIQTLGQIDSILRGWAGAFQYSQSMQSLRSLDERIDRKLAVFEMWFEKTIEGQPTHIQRRAMGVRLLGDTTPTPLPELS